MTDPAVIAFRGQYRFLSNFWPCTIHMDAFIYPSVEHAYQAAKSLDLAYRERIRDAYTASVAKNIGRRMTLRPGWEDMKLEVMYQLVRQKFTNDNEDSRSLKVQLLATGDSELCEGNTWGDMYWGTVGGVGMNHLGRILMRVREELRREADVYGN